MSKFIINTIRNAQIELAPGQKIRVDKNGNYHYNNMMVRNFLTIPTVIITGKTVPFNSVLEYDDDDNGPNNSSSKQEEVDVR